ncbi:GNAT family N-acetyltransferase [Pedosphaera parvula]|uniref:GCN5-related N-acetyltransferase n=1 Tax=Pedosphaera parvula (strain Ellin514) TaxID=320771 RepID=B9XK38_PEDPL|nr:GNAT family N-acetyltransferase [Pedosphaera parvula]EEF59861.1 GCN5-related N-acetyltransferase [Pedosphaera parvula Ellin514]
MNIRTANLSDAEVVADFNLRLAWESEHLKLAPETVRKGVGALLKAAAKGVYFVAEETGAGVVGQTLVTYEWSDWRNGNIWWIQSVFVKEEFRGQGVFKALFEHVERLAKESGEVCSLRLYVEKENSRAHRAYSKLGMEETHYRIFEKAIR